MPGARALEWITRLEKTPKPAQAWLDFGIRVRYRSGRAIEFPDRLAVPIMAGGNCRPAVIKAIGEAQEMYVAFSLATSVEELDSKLQALAQKDHVSVARGTQPIQLAAIEIFGKLVIVGKLLHERLASRPEDVLG